MVLNANLIPNNYPFYYLLLLSVFVILFSILNNQILEVRIKNMEFLVNSKSMKRKTSLLLMKLAYIWQGAFLLRG